MVRERVGERELERDGWRERVGERWLERRELERESWRERERVGVRESERVRE